MWMLICCYLLGHEYNVACDAGSVFLRCSACGRRSHGWSVKTG